MKQLYDIKKSVYIKNHLKKEIQNFYSIKNGLLKEYKKINDVINLLYKTVKQKRNIYICGNGGSAADAQHIAAECMVRLTSKVNREPIPMISLALDMSTLTACANDYSFKNIFSRNLDGLGKKNDTLIVLSTSGKSKNIIEVLKVAKKKKINSIALLGNKGGNAKKLAKISIIINSKNTARIQEAHMFLGHFIVENLEMKLLKKK